jgi:hypothetical protein
MRVSGGWPAKRFDRVNIDPRLHFIANRVEEQSRGTDRPVLGQADSAPLLKVRFPPD